MPDKFDYASSLTEREREASIERARKETPQKRGPYKCIRCDQVNDRTQHAICSDCFEALNGQKR